MTFTEARYENAIYRMDYIDGLKKELAMLLASRVHILHSGMYVGEGSLALAQTCLGEVVDDLFYLERAQAREIIECWQQGER